MGAYITHRVIGLLHILKCVCVWMCVIIRKLLMNVYELTMPTKSIKVNKIQRNNLSTISYGLASLTFIQIRFYKMKAFIYRIERISKRIYIYIWSLILMVRCNSDMYSLSITDSNSLNWFKWRKSNFFSKRFFPRFDKWIQNRFWFNFWENILVLIIHKCMDINRRN